MTSIESLEENEFVRNLTKQSVPQAEYLWIGAKRTGSELLDFEWENGDPFLYSNWDSGKSYPDNYGGNENYAYMLLNHGFWGDVDGTHNYNFICESTLTDE
jgi:hypothetical protein